MDDRRFDAMSRRLGESTTRRRVLGVLAGLAGLYLSGAAANRAEAKPEREVIDVGGDFTNHACGFLVQVHVEGKVVSLDFNDRLLLAQPGAKVELTNPENGASLRLSIAGPEFDTFHEDGSVTVTGTGPWSWSRRHPVTGEPGIWQTNGRFVWVFDPDGNLISAELHGTSENVCEVLA